MERNYFEELMNQTLTKDQIEVRIADVDMNGFTLVVYKTRNADKNILDNIVGPSNWQKGHNGNPHNCYVEIWDPVKQMWIHKDNFGESLDRSTKGSATDAMKRAGEDWGIGRELYTCPRIFIKSPTVEVSYGTGYELPDDVRATYDNENMFVKELIVESKEGSKFIRKITLAFANGEEFFSWEKNNPQNSFATAAVSEQNLQAEDTTGSAAQNVSKSSEQPQSTKTSKKTQNDSTKEDTKENQTIENVNSVSKKSDSSESVLLDTNAETKTPDVSAEAYREEAPHSQAATQAAIPNPVQTPQPDAAIEPQDVVFALLDGYDPKKEGLRAYEGKTMRQLLEENPSVINIVANPTFKWEAKMEKYVWEAAKETVRLSRMI